MRELFRKASVRIAAVCLGVLILAGIVFACQALFDPYGNRIVEGVSIGGLDLGGMTRREARQALQAAAQETVLAENLIVELPKETLQLSPAELEMQLNVRAAVRTAFRAGRTEDVTVSEIGLAPYLTLNEDIIRQKLLSYAAAHDTVLTQPTYRMEGDMPELSTERNISEINGQTLILTTGLPEAHLDVENTLQAVWNTFDSAIGSCRNSTYCLRVDVPCDAVPDTLDLEAIYREFSAASVNDSLDMTTYGFVHGSYGYHFDTAVARQAIDDAVYGESISIPMVFEIPEIIGEGAYFRDVLGSCETKHNTNENRNNNLRLLCAALDGLILQPGEDFSYNETVGERTAERGYKPAPAYSGNRLVDSIGGGVCQGSSTLYNCVLLADLEVTNRLCHGGPVSYLPLGLDATVNWGTADFCFRNSANFPIKIQAEVSDGYVKMKILGTDEKDYYVKLEPRSWSEGDITYANCYMLKYSKETDELISREQITHSVYYAVG